MADLGLQLCKLRMHLAVENVAGSHPWSGQQQGWGKCLEPLSVTQPPAMEHLCRLCCLPTSLTCTSHLLCEPENFVCPSNSEVNGLFLIFIINAISVIKGYQEPAFEGCIKGDDG